MNPFERIKSKIRAELGDKLPKKWKKIGDVLIVDFYLIPKEDKDEIADSFVELGEAVRKLERDLMLGLREMRQNQSNIQGQLREVQTNLDRAASGLREDHGQLTGRLEVVEREDRRDLQAVEGLGAGLRHLAAGLGKVQADLYAFQLSKRNNLLFHGLERKPGEEETQVRILDTPCS